MQPGKYIITNIYNFSLPSQILKPLSVITVLIIWYVSDWICTFLHLANINKKFYKPTECVLIKTHNTVSTPDALRQKTLETH